MTEDTLNPHGEGLPRLVLLSDEPTPDHEHDGLDMQRYAKVIAGAALSAGSLHDGVCGDRDEGRRATLLRQAAPLDRTKEARPVAPPSGDRHGARGLSVRASSSGFAREETRGWLPSRA